MATIPVTAHSNTILNQNANQQYGCVINALIHANIITKKKKKSGWIKCLTPEATETHSSYTATKTWPQQDKTRHDSTDQTARDPNP